LKLTEKTHASLFSGIGGFDLAADWIGWKNVFHCEINPFARQILNYYWPNAISYEDIKKTDFTIWRGLIDVLTGGFPCQPYSQTGKRKGKKDERHLWPEMLRAIREIQPGYVVGENVYGLLNWNGGMVFDEIQADLEAEGYEVQPVILPSCGVDAPHRRDRIWFIAYSSLFQRNPERKEGQQCRHGRQTFSKSNGIAKQKPFTDTNSKRLQRKGSNKELGGKKRFSKRNAYSNKTNWENFPTKSPICRGNDGISRELDGITFSKWRQESIKGYGNAIVPQVAYEIFKVIDKLNL